MLKISNISGFESIKPINSKRQPPSLKELLTKAEFNNEEVGVGKWQTVNVVSHCYYSKTIHLKM